MTVLVLFTSLLLFPSLVYGGMDFSGLGGNNAMLSKWENWGKINWDLFYQKYKLPVFTSQVEAYRWARTTKWVEPIRRMLWHEINHLRDLQDYNSHTLTPEGIKRAGEIAEQVSFLETAVLEIEQAKIRKDKGKLDAAQVGSTFYAYSIPVKQ